MCDSDEEDMCDHCYNLVDCEHIQHTPYEYFLRVENYKPIYTWQLEKLVNFYLKPKTPYKAREHFHTEHLLRRDAFRTWEIKSLKKWVSGESSVAEVLLLDVLTALQIIPPCNYVLY